MSRWESWLFGASQALLAVTGVVYFVMKYMIETDDPFAVINHPWQPFFLNAHVLAAPLGLVLFGVVFRSHVLMQLRSSIAGRRRSGWISLVSFGLMALSGYLLQVVASPALLRATLVVHVATSIVFILGYATHLVIGYRPAAASEGEDAERAASAPTLTM